jgi:large subunit ribosomal protein L30
MAPKNAPEKAAETDRLKITQVRSTIGTRWRQRESLRTLGLRKIRQSVVRENNAQTRGLITVVRHLVKVEAVEAVEAAEPTSTGGSKK